MGPVQRVVAFPAGSADHGGNDSSGITLHPDGDAAGRGTRVLAVAMLDVRIGPAGSGLRRAARPLGLGRDLAVALAASGIASLRYDKRGVGASGG